MSSVSFALFCVGMFSLGWVIGQRVASGGSRYRRWIKCHILRRHDGDRPYDVPGGASHGFGGERVQRCIWCDRVLMRWHVTQTEAEQQTIRRIY